MSRQPLNLFPTINDRVIEEIVKQIEKGVMPYEMPWRGAEVWPWNYKTKRQYSGINLQILGCAGWNGGYRNGRWLTERQARSIGGRVREGEKGTMIFFGMRRQNGETPARGIYRQFMVWNVEQCDGLPEPDPPPPPDAEKLKLFEALVASTGADIRIGGTLAFYHPEEDYIQIPATEFFYHPENDRPRTLAHELAHWSAHPTRLNRKMPGDHALARHAYEEICAELTAAFLCNRFKITPSVRSSDYIAAWHFGIKTRFGVLLPIRDAISLVAPDAVRAADYLLGFAVG
ncbi:ssDNA-binding domain-containing protein [bacterium]|nr:ssDNA-binding domain-containing protein [bacterium]MBY0510196.1 ssDNA-binding domain-containing protein [Rhodospirillaceae bacterium]